MNAWMRDKRAGMRRGAEGPAWRELWAQSLMWPLPPRRRKDLEPLVEQLTEYLARQREGQATELLSAKFPHIAAAYALQDDCELRTAAKVLTLAGVPAEEICGRLSLAQEMYHTWELLFFDVRPNRRAVDWVMAHVIGPEQVAGNTLCAAKLKLVLATGAATAATIAELGINQPLDAAERLIRRALQLSIMWDEAANRVLHTDRQRMNFLRLCANLQLAERRLDLARAKLAARCAAQQHKHDQAMVRLQQRRERSQSATTQRAAQPEPVAQPGAPAGSTTNKRPLDSESAA